MLQSSISSDAMAPWFHEARWRECMQHASDVRAYADMAICLYMAILGCSGPEWMLE